jgi:hypothetical protein
MMLYGYHAMNKRQQEKFILLNFLLRAFCLLGSAIAKTATPSPIHALSARLSLFD